MFPSMLRSSVRRLSTSARLCSNKLYELRIYTFKISNIKALVETSSVALPFRYSQSPGLGYFFSEIGGLGETVHVWEYDSYQSRANVRKALAADAGWMTAAAPMLKLLESQDNLTMRLFSWSTIQTEVKPGGVYFMYTFSFQPGTSSDVMSSQLENFVKEADLTALGVWREELGPNSLTNAYGLFHSPEFDSVKNPALASSQAWDKLRKYTTKVHGRLLTPAQWSSYK